jgi:hypothetical protein
MTLINLRTMANLSTFSVILGAMLISLSTPQGPFGRAQVDRQESNITFTSMGAGSGKTEDGSDYSFSSMKSSDGVWVSTRTERRKSASRANAVMKRTLRGAEIRGRGPKINSSGKRVGERVVAYFPSKRRNAVLWTDGSDFHYLESESLSHILAYEKKYYP